MKTWNAKPGEVEGKWWLVDATDQTVGRLATQIANVIRGKNKPTFTPHVDTGDFVVVVNADKIKFSGDKWLSQVYYRHSRYFGSLKQLNAEQLHQKDPTKIVTEAVRGMLPKNKLSRKIIKKLKAYSGSEHPHDAQKPQALTF
jgi:large subunit ribosomal protein L13